MREILFRGKRTDTGEWVEGYYVRYGNTGKEKHYIVPVYASDLYAFQVDENTVCQWTGLKDKNRKKIWENDIVRCGGIMKIAWSKEKASWVLSKKGWLFNHFFGESVEPEDVEVVGNIFDNPELVN